jgi:hypothetical protein
MSTSHARRNLFEDPITESSSAPELAGSSPTTITAQFNERAPMNKWAVELQKGYSNVAEAILKEAQGRQLAAVRTDEPNSVLTFAIVEVLSRIPSMFLVELMGGNLPLAAAKEERVRRKLQQFSEFATARLLQLQNKQETAPCIYVRYLVNAEGNSPTPNDLLGIIAQMRRYERGEVDTYRLDRIVAATAHPRLAPRYCHSQSQRQTVHSFCDNVERFLHTIVEEDMNKPLPSPLKYVGYSSSYRTRLESHNNHAAESPGPMCLMEMLFRNKWEQTMFPSYQERYAAKAKQLYRLHSYVVFVPHSASYAALSELVVTIITESMYYTGQGFNIGNPGQNNPISEYNHTQWDICERWMATNSDWHSNMKAWKMQQKAITDNRSNIQIGMERDRAKCEVMFGRLHDELQENEKYPNTKLERTNTSEVNAKLTAISKRFGLDWRSVRNQKPEI